MTSTTSDRRKPRGSRPSRPAQAAPAPEAEPTFATGVAGGSLGTGTAVDDETTLMAVPESPDSIESRQTIAAVANAEPAQAAMPGPKTAAPVAAPAVPAAAAAAPATAPAMAEHRATARRDPYRPIGIALAAILVALAGVAVLSSGRDTPPQVGAPSVATDAQPTNVGGGEDSEDDRDSGGAKGNCNGRGNDPCDREGGGDD